MNGPKEKKGKNYNYGKKMKIKTQQDKTSETH